MSGAFPPDFFGPDYFGPDYFGGETTTDPNRMRATLAGTSTFGGNLTAATVDPPAEVTGGGGGRKKRLVSTKPFKKPELIEREGLPEVYQRKRRILTTAVARTLETTVARTEPLSDEALAASADTLAKLFLETPQTEAQIEAAALAARNEQAIQALLVMLPLLDLEPDVNEQAAQALLVLPLILELEGEV